MNFCACRSDFIPQENSGGIAKCQLISGYSSPCQHLACVLFFTVNSSSRCNLLLYNISFVFPKLWVKNAMWISFRVVYFPQYWFTSVLTLRLIHQTGLTDNIDEVIKEYKETRGLLVWEAFHPWYIMFWYLNCMWHSLHNSHFLLANRRFMWEMREGIGWKGPFCICCISLHASSLFLALLLLGWKELMETIIMQATQFLLDF